MYSLSRLPVTPPRLLLDEAGSLTGDIVRLPEDYG